MWISQRLRVHLPNQGHVTTATNICARYITPKQIRNDHAKAFIHVAIIVSSRRSLGGRGYFMLDPTAMDLSPFVVPEILRT